MTKRTRVYIAGPMTGVLRFNYPAFMDADQRLTDAGYRVVNPARLFDGRMNLPRNQYLIGGIRALLKCNAIALLEGWRDSEGASVEEHIARAMKMQRVCPYSCKVLPTWLQAMEAAA